MFKLIVLFCLVGVAWSTPIYNKNERIVGGYEVVPHSFPFQAALESYDFYLYTIHCGGAVISRNWILTAAQCVDK